MLATWGHLVYRRRWAALALSLLVLVASIGVLAQAGSLGNGNNTQTEAGRAASLIDSELPRTSGSSFAVIFGSPTLSVHDVRFRRAMQTALGPLRADRRVTSVQTPYDMGPAQAAAMESRDGHYALAVIAVRDGSGTAQGYYPELRALIHSSTLSTMAVGDLAINHDFDHILGQDLQRAEQVSLPLVLLLLLLVFGTLLAALLPLGVGMLAVVGGFAGIYLLARLTPVSQYAFNVVTLVGLGVAVDYSLFIVSRFREELARGATVENALARALDTAGRAIVFSGLTVAIGLAGLLFYQGTFLASMGGAGAIVVAFAVLYALTFLPAVLALLGPRVNAWRLPLGRRQSGRSLWHGLATAVMRRPVVVLALTVPFILLAGSPVLGIRLANSDVTALPPQAETHRGVDLLRRQFPGQDQTQISVVVRYPGGRVLSAARVGALYDLSRRIAALPDVLRVEGPVNVDPSLNRAGYQALYARPQATLPAAVRAQVRQNVGTHIVLLTVLSARPAASDQARDLVRTIRALHTAGDGHILVTGQTAFDLDTITLIADDTPAALGFIVVMTYLVLFLLLGSVVLPLKAIVMDMLSIMASFGLLVWIFQQGHLAAQLNFTPASLDPSVPVLLFGIVFGLSMDYEVLLLSRMKEEHEHTGETRQAVAAGLERSGRLITGAAAIMVAVFLAFALADSVIIKAIGLGLALAVAIDATIVRALIVPATMRLLGGLNWWAPRPLAHLHRRLHGTDALPVREVAA